MYTEVVSVESVDCAVFAEFVEYDVVPVGYVVHYFH